MVYDVKRLDLSPSSSHAHLTTQFPCSLPSASPNQACGSIGHVQPTYASVYSFQYYLVSPAEFCSSCSTLHRHHILLNQTQERPRTRTNIDKCPAAYPFPEQIDDCPAGARGSFRGISSSISQINSRCRDLLRWLLQDWLDLLNQLNHRVYQALLLCGRSCGLKILLD